jgi:hypothetical protein
VTDTSVSRTFDDTLAAYLAQGFTEVDRIEFSNLFDHALTEALVVLWHPEGVLATCRSFLGLASGATCYFNWCGSRALADQIGGSGYFLEDVWVGNRSMGSDMQPALQQLRAGGEFLPRWIQQPFLWIASYNESRDPLIDKDALTRERLARLPADVQAAVLA